MATAFFRRIPADYCRGMRAEALSFGDILIEAASSSAVGVSPRTEWKKNVMFRLASPVLIRGLRLWPFLPRENVITHSLERYEGELLISGLPPRHCYPRNCIISFESALTIDHIFRKSLR